MMNEEALKQPTDVIYLTREAYADLCRRAAKAGDLEMELAEKKPEPCEDTISRKHLLSEIDALMQSPWFNNGKDDDMFTHYGYVERKEAVEIVRDLCIKKEPPVTPKQRWIPVSERLPENNGYYLVTEKRGRVCSYVFRKEGNSEEYWRRCAEAWMPFPEPYKEGESE